MKLRIVPVNRDQAFAFITLWHRHHPAPQGYRFALGVAAGPVLVGVATVGRPVARFLDDGATAEVTRVATDGTPNACSALYGASWRAAKAMGYARGITYNQDGESGASLRAAGWTPLAIRPPRRGWSAPSRLRDDTTYLPAGRTLWHIESNATDGHLPTSSSLPPTEPDHSLTLFDLMDGAPHNTTPTA
jgi:hypothetical protein